MKKLQNRAVAALTVIPHVVDDCVVSQRAEDGYINATEMCRAADRQIGHYLENAQTRDFLRELSLTIGIPIVKLVEVREGRYGGTWIHPRVAIHFGQWLSSVFAVLVSGWVLDWTSGKQPNIRQPVQTIGAYIRRSVINAQHLPPGHFSILGQVADLLVGPMESLGHILPDDCWPDISVGLRFCSHLKGKGFDTDALPTYDHKCQTGFVAKAKAYPDCMLPMARKWIREVWMVEHAAKYFASKKDEEALALCETISVGSGTKRMGPGRALSSNKVAEIG